MSQKKELLSPLDIISTPWYKLKLVNNPENYHIPSDILNISSEINERINDIVLSLPEKLSNKIQERFSSLPVEYRHLAEMTYWDLEHSYWWNRLFIKSKIMDAIKLWKSFTYASYDINWMWITNNLSKNLWNTRILELSEISHDIIDFLNKQIDEKWEKYESFFSRTWWDEFSLFSTAPDYIVKKAIEYWRLKELWHIKNVLNKENYENLLLNTASTKWWNTEEEILQKISWFTIWINQFDYSWLKIQNLQEEYKKIVISSDETMEHAKSWKSKQKLENWIVMWNSCELKHKTWKEKAEELQNFEQKNELDKNQNKNFEKIWKKLEKKIKKNFFKLTKNRNLIIKKLNLDKNKIDELDYLLEKAKYTENEIYEIQKITGLEKDEIDKLKIEYMQALFARGHYTWSYQPQIHNIISSHPESWFSISNKIVINTPSFKSINEISWHTNWDYFLMAYVQHLKDLILEIFEKEWVDKKWKTWFWKNIILVSKWPNTEIFINDLIIEKIPDIVHQFKDKIENSLFLKEFDEKIWKDENWESLNDKRINFIKEKQKNKIIDKTKELILIKLWKTLQNNELDWINSEDEIISFYKKNKMDEIVKKLSERWEVIKKQKLNIIWEILVNELKEEAEKLIRSDLEKFEILK